MQINQGSKYDDFIPPYVRVTTAPRSSHLSNMTGSEETSCAPDKTKQSITSLRQSCDTKIAFILFQTAYKQSQIPPRQN